MKSFELLKGPIPSIVQIPGSKSYANRLLILVSLSNRPITISHLPNASDVTLLLSALQQIGLDIVMESDSVTIRNSFPDCENSGCRIEVGEGGTTARFLASLLLRGKQRYILVLGKRLKERPWDEFIHFAKQYGAMAELNGNELTLQGPMNLPSEISMDCSRTTQFASGVQLSFAGLTRVHPLNMKSSQSYWSMTESLIDSIKTISSFDIPLDWSSASYPLAFAALNQKTSFPYLRFDHYQSDAKFFKLLQEFDAISETSQGIEVKPLSKHHPVTIDVSDCLDLVPTLGYFLSHIKGVHVLNGVTNLVHKESDRLNELMILLKQFDRKSWVESDTLYIEGKIEITEGMKNLTLPDDHRMVMAGALFLRHHSGGFIAPARAVEKSYPSFFELFIPDRHQGAP